MGGASLVSKTMQILPGDETAEDSTALHVGFASQGMAGR
jgi:hypothetical protein